MLDTISILIVEVKNALEQIIQVLQPNDSCRPKSGVGDMFGKSLRNVLHVRELSKLKKFHEHIAFGLNILVIKK